MTNTKPLTARKPSGVLPFVLTFRYVLRGCVSASLGDLLESADAEYDGDTDQVGDSARVDQEQSTGDTRDAQRPVHVVKGIASESRGNAEDADEGGADDLYALQRACEIDQQKGRIQTEAIWYNEGCDCQRGRVERGLHRSGARDRTACVGCQRDRWCDIGNDTEVEYEHVRTEYRHIHLHQDRRAGGRHNDIVCGGRNAHAEDDAGHHGQEHRDKQIAARQSDNRGNQFGADTCRCDDAGDHTGNRASGAYGQGAFCGILQRIKELARCDACFLAEQADYDSQKRTDDSGHSHGRLENEDDQCDQRNQQIALGEQGLEELRQMLFGESLQPGFLCFQVDCDEYTGKIQEGRDDRFDRNRAVRRTCVFCHQEGSSAHNRRHDLSAGRCSRFYRACEFRFVTGSFHHWNGDRTCSNGIADRGAGNHTAEGRGDDRDLRRTAVRTARDGIRQLDEEVRDAGFS